MSRTVVVTGASAGIGRPVAHAARGDRPVPPAHGRTGPPASLSAGAPADAP